MIQSLVGALMLLLVIPYLVLAMLAYPHLKEMKGISRWVAASTSWALNDHLYTEEAKRFCAAGKIIFYVDAVLLIVWLLLIFGG